MSNYLTHFASFCFVLQFESPLFDSFQFVSGYRLYRFDSAMNQNTKTTIRPSLSHRHLCHITCAVCVTCLPIVACLKVLCNVPNTFLSKLLLLLIPKGYSHNFITLTIRDKVCHDLLPLYFTLKTNG